MKTFTQCVVIFKFLLLLSIASANQNSRCYNDVYQSFDHNQSMFTYSQKKLAKQEFLDRDYNTDYSYRGRTKSPLVQKKYKRLPDYKALPYKSSQISKQSYYHNCAENGSCYGDINLDTGKVKTTYVRGYHRKDGTYVRGYYRSKSR